MAYVFQFPGLLLQFLRSASVSQIYQQKRVEATYDKRENATRYQETFGNEHHANEINCRKYWNINYV